MAQTLYKLAIIPSIMVADVSCFMKLPVIEVPESVGKLQIVGGQVIYHVYKERDRSEWGKNLFYPL